MNKEWPPFIAACLLSVLVGTGAGLSQLAIGHLPYKTTINNKREENYKSQSGEQSNGPTDIFARTDKPNGKEKGRPDACYQNETNGECAARIVQDKVAGFYVWLVISSCIQALAGLLTIAVIIYQAFLTKKQLRATEIASNAAGIASRAAVASNLAEITLVSIAVVPFPDLPDGMQEQTIPPGPLPLTFKPVAVLCNLGNSRCMLTSICLNWKFVERVSVDQNPDIDPLPNYEKIVGRNYIFIANQTIGLKADFPIVIDEATRTRIAENSTWLWVYGFYEFTDFMGDSFRVGFVAHWEAVAGGTLPNTHLPHARGFVLEGPPAYNYKQKCQ